MRVNGVYFDRGENDILFAEDGAEFIDLQTGFGAVILGHSNPNIVPHLSAQIDKIWTTGRLPSKVVESAQAALQEFLPAQLVPTMFSSSGLEAAEFALRIASVITGRSAFIGFARSMHGKSVATIELCWPSQFGTIPGFHCLPFLPEVEEQDVLANLEAVLSSEKVAGVFIEPLLGSSGGYSASPAFYQQAIALCERYGALSVFDEILTGYYRTGSRFCAEHLGVTPDILLSGKAVGNGFPVAINALHERYSLTPAMLPGSTFSNNPLAAAVVGATLREMERIDMPAKISSISDTIPGYFNDLAELGVVLRGKGALWILQLPFQQAGQLILEKCLDRGVLVSASGEFLRILPAATIEPENLERACGIVKQASIEVLEDLIQSNSLQPKKVG